MFMMKSINNKTEKDVQQFLGKKCAMMPFDTFKKAIKVYEEK